MTFRHQSRNSERFPIAAAAVDIDHDLVDITIAPRAESARLLIRNRGMPLGFATVPVRNDVVRRDDIEDAIEHAIDSWQSRPTTTLPVRVHTADAEAELISVVVPTHRRPETLRRLLVSLAAQSHSAFEVVVVDNGTPAPAPEIVSEFGDERFRYLHEPLANASNARNEGVRAARADLIAMIDDDCVADPEWLAKLIDVFHGGDDIGCVTGFAPSRRVDNEVQVIAEALIAMGDWFVPRSFSINDPTPIVPFASGKVGGSGNCAFRRSCLERVGLFDCALGPGAPARSGEDLDIFARVLLAGFRIEYAPDALIWQDLRADVRELRSQSWAYGVGLSAYVTKILARRETRSQVLRSIPEGVRRFLRSQHETGATVPWSVRLPGLLGLMWGPVAYARGALERGRGTTEPALAPRP